MTENPLTPDRVIFEEMDNYLIPCPLCGSSKVHACGDKQYGLFGVECFNAGCCCSIKGFVSLETAIWHWNDRPREQKFKAVLKDAKQGLDEIADLLVAFKRR